MKKLYEIFMRIAAVVFLTFAAMSCSDDKTIDTSQNGTGGKPGIAVTGISLSQKSVEMEIGERIPITVTIAPEDATDKSYTWTSANPAIVSVENDVLIAHALGKMSVTVSSNDGSYVAVISVSIAMPKIPATGITVSPTEAVLGIGEKLTLTTTILPEDATDKNYAWSSSNPAIATVENDIVTAHAAGNAVITATANDGNFTATCNITVSASRFAATGAGAYNLGDQWYNGCDNIILYLTTGSVKASGLSLNGEGTALWLDMNAPKTGNMAIPAGTYTALLEEPGPGESQDFTFPPGVDMGAWGVGGAFIYQLKAGAADRELIMIEDGVVTVAVSGSIYTVTANVTAAGQQYEFFYSGKITVTDDTTGGGGDDDQYEVVEMKNLAKGEMWYAGKSYGETGTDYANWMIYLADATIEMSDLSGPGEILQIEINTASSATTSITPGTYTVFEEIAPTSFVPFSSVPGFIQEGYLYGTWYINGDAEIFYGATAGTVEVSKSGNNYTLDFEFIDEAAEGKPVKYIGTYTGPLDYYNGVQTAAPASGIRKAPAKVSKSIAAPTRRITFRK